MQPSSRPRRTPCRTPSVVVIDVLRASSTIVAAIESGAERIIPIADVETASRLVRPAERDRKLLAGERKCCPVPGFDLCNSPGDFTPERVRGKTIVFTTTNGTRAIAAAAKAARVLICALTKRACRRRRAPRREGCRRDLLRRGRDHRGGGSSLRGTAARGARRRGARRVSLTDAARLARIMAGAIRP